MIGDMPRDAGGDPVLLKQVFANLISNAFKFTRKREEPRIEIGGYQEHGHQVYFVRANGAGFPSENADDLFRAFQRLHSQSDFEGTGIGLANVRKIIERHGGHVWAKGEAGQGAMFFFALPLS
jgi:light-regulated signal transduction histidine kinase (bacteriophytochrome)